MPKVFSVLLAVGAAVHASAQGKPMGPPQQPGGGGAMGGPPPGAPPAGGPPAAGPHGSQPGNTPPPSSNGSGGRNPLQFGPVGRWWDDKAVVQTIGLRKDQQQKMDQIFDANKSAILSSYKTFLSEQAKLDALSKKTDADKTAMFAAIDAVSQARAALQKANTQMLLQIRGQMEPGQIVKLEKLP